jgi:hypothetical protein
VNYQRTNLILSSIVLLTIPSCTRIPMSVANLEKSRFPVRGVDEFNGENMPNATEKKDDTLKFTDISFPSLNPETNVPSSDSVKSPKMQAKTSGEIQQIIFQSWSDGNYPSQKLKKITNSQSTIPQRKYSEFEKNSSSMSDLAE